MKFQVYQIQFTESQYRAINSNETVPAFEARNRMTMDFGGDNIGNIASDAFEAGYYTHVSNIEAADLEQVFEIGNIGPESDIERLGRMSSISVGDILIDESGTKSVVASFGFKEVN